MKRRIYEFDEGYTAIVLARSAKHAIRILSKAFKIDRASLRKYIKTGKVKVNSPDFEDEMLTDEESHYYMTSYKTNRKGKSQFLGWCD